MTALPEVRGLTIDQRRGLACVRCRKRLSQSVCVGSVTDALGGLDLWACPACATAQEREAYAASGSGTCGLCGGHTALPVVIREVHAEYAHRSCAKQHGRTPIETSPAATTSAAARHGTPESRHPPAEAPQSAQTVAPTTPPYEQAHPRAQASRRTRTDSKDPHRQPGTQPPTAQ